LLEPGRPSDVCAIAAGDTCEARYLWALACQEKNSPKEAMPESRKLRRGCG
jgi:hypothetical protein